MRRILRFNGQKQVLSSQAWQGVLLGVPVKVKHGGVGRKARAFVSFTSKQKTVVVVISDVLLRVAFTEDAGDQGRVCALKYLLTPA